MWQKILKKLLKATLKESNSLRTVTMLFFVGLVMMMQSNDEPKANLIDENSWIVNSVSQAMT